MSVQAIATMLILLIPIFLMIPRKAHLNYLNRKMKND